MKVNVKLEVQYDGTDFNGWQIQEGQTGSRTVQSELKQAVEKIVKEPVVLIGAGRTDAGVHRLKFLISTNKPPSLGSGNISSNPRICI